jgi:selenoprotein W-related protein
MTEELLPEFATVVHSWTLVPASGGVYEVELNDTLVYSKRATGRHATAVEIRAAIRDWLNANHPNPHEAPP